jgi:hypothetical protein
LAMNYILQHTTPVPQLNVVIAVHRYIFPRAFGA